jgi:hypothetical protein
MELLRSWHWTGIPKERGDKGALQRSARGLEEEANESGKIWSEIKESGQQQKRMEKLYPFPVFDYKEGQELMIM